MKRIAVITAAVATIATPLPAQTAASSGPTVLDGMRYRMVGPSRGGRVTAVAGHPETPGTFYMGATGGGVWKSTDYGQHWTNVSDGYVHTGSIGAMQVAPSDPSVVYVGTGSDGLRSNVIAGTGVYRSDDAGETWTHRGLRMAGQIGAVVVHPDDPDIVFVAAIGNAFAPNPERGVFRSRDGGSTWEHVLVVSDSTGAVDLEFAPDDPQTVYASLWRAERKPWTIISGAREGGVFRSTDAGDSWRQLGSGLPSELIGKSDLAVSPADPDRLYVLMEAEPGGGLYRSDDRGEHFALVSTHAGILNRPFYYTNVDADPNDADVVYVGNERFFKSVDGGRTFQRMATPHGDNHDLWIDPNNSDVFIQSNDGGANVTRDGGATWSTQHNQPTAELYSVDVDNQFPYWLYSGQQDNTTIAVPSLPPTPRPGGAPAHWLSVGGCETGPVVPKPDDHTIVYANCKGRFSRYSKRTGQDREFSVGAANMYGHNPKDLRYRFQRVAPVEVSPHDPNTVYHGSQFVHRTTDGGETWETISPDLTAFASDKQVISGGPITRDITGEEFYSALYAIEESPLVPGIIWAGSNDGPIHVTRDAGQSWEDVTPPDLPEGGRVQSITPSAHQPGTAYVAVYRYLLGDFQPYAYRTRDFGQTWTRVTTGDNGVPRDYPTRVIRDDPDREGLLYLGTEFGMFVSFDDGTRWLPFQQNLPVTPVTDIRVHRQDLVLSTMGRSFWILDNITPLHDSAGIRPPEPRLFPADGYRMRYPAGSSSATDPEYPEPGVLISYFLPDTVTDSLTIEILGADGSLIRRYRSGSEELHDDVPWFGERSVTVGTTPGLHRIRWDMRHGTPVERGRQLPRGPLAVPGRYIVRLAIGASVMSRTLTLRADPRLADDGVTADDIRRQLDVSLAVHGLLGEAEALLTSVRAARDTADGERRDALRRLEAELATEPEPRYSEPQLIDQLRYLYGILQGADQAPGRDAMQRADELRAELARLTSVAAQLGAG